MKGLFELICFLTRKRKEKERVKGLFEHVCVFEEESRREKGRFLERFVEETIGIRLYDQKKYAVLILMGLVVVVECLQHICGENHQVR